MQTNSSKRIVLTSLGTHGDIIPFLGIGKALLEMGHRPVLAASTYFEALARSHGLDFAPVAPHHADLDRDLKMDHTQRLARQFDQLRGGPKFIAEKMIFPYLDQIFDELDQACEGADLLIAQPTSPWAHMVAHKRQIPWKSLFLQGMPLGLQSGQDPAVLTQAVPMHRLNRVLGPRGYLSVMKTLRNTMRPMLKPLDEKAKLLGIYDPQLNPMFDHYFSPWGSLALFPEQMMNAPTDLPGNVTYTGFSYFDAGNATLSPELQSFLDDGEPPVVFSLGSSVVFKVAGLYAQWSQMCADMGVRALFLTADQSLTQQLPATQMAVPWVSVSALFPHCRAVVNAGGIGMCAQAIRAGLPQLIVPFGFDQPDNAHRVARLGASLTLSPSKAKGRTMVQAMQRLLNDSALTENAKRLQSSVNQTCGSERAAQLIVQDL